MRCSAGRKRSEGYFWSREQEFTEDSPPELGQFLTGNRKKSSDVLPRLKLRGFSVYSDVTAPLLSD